jgi:lysyl-tRNA synthetase class 2
MQTLAENLCVHVAQTVFGTLKIAGTQPGSEAIDLTPPWRVVAYADLLKARMGADWYSTSAADARKKAEGMGLVIEPAWKLPEITHEIFEKVIQRTLIQPTFVTRLPAGLVPLAKSCEDDPSAADVFELIIGGKEIAPAYSELNDPLEQRRKLEIQAAGNNERIDEDFLRALEHGMPPAGGMGFGVDRLLMILSGSDAIRDVILFPQLKHKSQEA